MKEATETIPGVAPVAVDFYHGFLQWIVYHVFTVAVMEKYLQVKR